MIHQNPELGTRVYRLVAQDECQALSYYHLLVEIAAKQVQHTPVATSSLHIRFRGRQLPHPPPLSPFPAHTQP